MTLRRAIISCSEIDTEALLRRIPVDLIDLQAAQFDSASFSALQKAVESYARTIVFTARIGFARTINDLCEAFFSGEYSRVCRIDRIFDNTEMDILLLKDLQGGSDDSLYDMTQSDRAERFGMSVNAIQARIHALQDGKDILGHRVKIDIAGRGRTAYDDTVHPIFLALNLKEAYLLTIAMQEVFSGTAFQSTASDIASDIYAQLSDYAHNILRPHIEKAGLHFSGNDADSPIPYRKESTDALYYLKSQEKCILRLADTAEYTGHICSEGNALVLITENGESVPLPSDPSLYTLCAAG